MLNPRNQLVIVTLAVLAVCGGVGGCARGGDGPPRADGHSAAWAVRDASPTLSGAPSNQPRRASFFHDGNAFDAVIDRPASGNSNGWGVLMIGGGLGNDLDWTTPGTVNVNGKAVAMTISGAAHADAPLLARALCERGFAVMRWSTIARGDPLAAEWPARSTPRTLAELTAQARAALGTMRRAGEIEADRVILLGHSLGAARACTIAAEDVGVKGLILLSPAYFARSTPAPASFRNAGLAIGEDVLRTTPLRCLALFGALDESRAVNAAAALALVDTPGFERFEAETLAGLGHQLGPQQGNLVGPIDQSVLDQVAAFAGAVARQP